MHYVETQFDRTFGAVYMLAAGTVGTQEAYDQLGFRQDDGSAHG
ncbi:hypothetical protein GCM10010872_38520 [Dyella flava]|nr:hypothetical protein GCM10010872_38520 [Dyella flava]